MSIEDHIAKALNPELYDLSFGRVFIEIAQLNSLGHTERGLPPSAWALDFAEDITSKANTEELQWVALLFEHMAEHLRTDHIAKTTGAIEAALTEEKG